MFFFPLQYFNIRHNTAPMPTVTSRSKNLPDKQNTQIPGYTTGNRENMGKIAIFFSANPHYSNLNYFDPVKNKTPESITQFLDQDPAQSVNQIFFTALTEAILLHFYPKHCTRCGSLMTNRIRTRPYSIRCPKCYNQKSRLSYTPLHHFKLPMWSALALHGFADTCPSMDIGCLAGFSIPLIRCTRHH